METEKQKEEDTPMKTGDKIVTEDDVHINSKSSLFFIENLTSFGNVAKHDKWWDLIEIKYDRE